MRYYLYRHIRLDKNIPFYIGIGTKPINVKFKSLKREFWRAYSKSHRNKFWKNITNKTKYEIEILYEDNNFEIIKEKEKEFIKLYGRKDLKKGELCNLTDGGEGTVNYIPNIDSINKRLEKIGKEVLDIETDIVYDSIKELANTLNIYPNKVIKLIRDQDRYIYLNNSKNIEIKKKNLQKLTSRRFAKKSSTSFYKGVSWNKEKKKWVSQIRIENKKIFLGYFDNEIDAFNKYNITLNNYLNEKRKN